MHVVVQKKNKELWNYSWQVAVGHINHVCACQKNRPPPPQATPYTPLFCSLLLAISVRHIAQLKPQPSRQKLKPYTAYLLKYGFYKQHFFSEWTTDQLNISWPFLSSLLGGCNTKATSNPLKSDDKNGQEMFNWWEVHSKKKYYL